MSLDPLFARGLFFLSNSERIKAEVDVAEKLYKLTQPHKPAKEDFNENEEDNSFDENNPWKRPSPKTSQTTDDFEAFLAIIAVSDFIFIVIYCLLQAEYDRFHHLKSQKLSNNESELPLDFWYKNRELLPNLAMASEIYFCVPSTSIDSERFFSKVTLLYADKLRNRISSSVAENILLLKNFYNLDDSKASILDDEDD